MINHCREAQLMRTPEEVSALSPRSRGLPSCEHRTRYCVLRLTNIERMPTLKTLPRPQIRWGFAMDFGERLPYLFHPDLTYKLNSKRWLGECDLKSSNDRILDCEITCSSNSGDLGHWYYCGKDCEEWRRGVLREIQRVRDILTERELPFVLKLTQSLSSVGTNIVTDNHEREALIDKITDYLQIYIPRITPENGHLYTTVLILSHAIRGATMALNFYVRRDGSVVFLGACHQLATGESGRQATTITYADQQELEVKYRATLARIGEALRDEGYYGPVGADIMEDPKDGTLFRMYARHTVSSCTPSRATSTMQGALV